MSSAEMADPAISGIAADPDHDGISNLMEYALGLAPKLSNSLGLPTGQREGNYLSFIYRENKDATDLIFTVLASSTLEDGTWTSDELTDTAREDMGEYWLVTVTDSHLVNANVRRFMRLQVSK